MKNLNLGKSRASFGRSGKPFPGAVRQNPAPEKTSPVCLLGTDLGTGPVRASRSFAPSGRKCPVHRGTEAAGLERPPRGVRSTLGPFRRGSRTGNRVLSAAGPTKSGPRIPESPVPLRKPFIHPVNRNPGLISEVETCRGTVFSLGAPVSESAKGTVLD